MKLIERYSVVKYDRFYLLHIHTTERGYYYHQYNNNSYQIEYDDGETVYSEDLIIDDFLPKDKTYLVFNTREKDFITYLFLDRDSMVDLSIGKIKSLGESIEVKRLKDSEELWKVIENRLNNEKK